jgi:type IV secretory pathway TrbF-like protein
MNIQKEKTPYEAAYIEWSDRIGQTRAQLNTWRMAALLSMLLALLLLVALIIVMSARKTYVYVAEVRPNENTVNQVLLPQRLTPTQAQESYFVGQFINNIMSLPLDPVVARQNWFDAYNMATGNAVSQLTSFAQANNPFNSLGAETKSVQISTINAVSDQSIQATWTAVTYNSQGVVQDQETYSGVFTFAQGPEPTTTAELLKNPFGLKITYFSINREG